MQFGRSGEFSNVVEARLWHLFSGWGTDAPGPPSVCGYTEAQDKIYLTKLLRKKQISQNCVWSADG